MTIKVLVETTGELARKLTITLPSEDFEIRVSERLQEAASKVRIDGFRPGKVPLKEVQRRFGSTVRQEVAGEVMQASFLEAIQQEDLSPAGSPGLEVVSLEPGVDLEFTATFEVFPDVEVGDLSKVKVRKPESQISEDDVENSVQRLLEQRQHWHDLDRSVQTGDRVTVDFVGRIDDEEFDGGKGEDVTFVVGKGQMIEDFDQGMVGMSVGDEKSISATFPEDYQAEKLQAKIAEFDIKLKEAAHAHMPELDNDFFKSFGVEEGGEERFREVVSDNMNDEMNAAIQSQVKRQVLDELCRLHDVVLPDSLIEREINVLRERMNQQLQMSLNTGDSSLPDDLFRKEAEKRVTVGLVINAIIEGESIKPDGDKVRERIEEIAKPYDQPDQIVNWYYSDEAQLQQMELAVLEDQVVEHVLGLGAVEALPTSYEEIISGRATAPLEQVIEETSEDVDTADTVSDNQGGP